MIDRVPHVVVSLTGREDSAGKDIILPGGFCAQSKFPGLLVKCKWHL